MLILSITGAEGDPHFQASGMFMLILSKRRIAGSPSLEKRAVPNSLTPP